jgi:hypothetical protein
MRDTDSVVIAQYAPMVPTLARDPFHRPEKVDGWRMLAYKDGAGVRLVSRNGVDHPKLSRVSAPPLPAYRPARSCSTVRLPCSIRISAPGSNGSVSLTRRRSPHRRYSWLSTCCAAAILI